MVKPTPENDGSPSQLKFFEYVDHDLLAASFSLLYVAMSESRFQGMMDWNNNYGQLQKQTQTSEWWIETTIDIFRKKPKLNVLSTSEFD